MPDEAPIHGAIQAARTLREINAWGEHDLYPRSDWKAEVANGDTQLGYWEWLEHRIEAALN